MIILALLFTFLIPTISTGQSTNTDLALDRPIPITLDIEFSEDGRVVTKQVSLLLDLNLVAELRAAGLTSTQIDALQFSPTIRTSADHDVTIQAQIRYLQEDSLGISAAPAEGNVPFTATVPQTANLYAEPSKSNAAVASVFADDNVTVIESSSDNRWYLLDNGYWIAATSIRSPEQLDVMLAPRTTIVPTPTSTPIAVTIRPSARSNSNLRSGPGTDYPVMAGVTAGKTLTITGRNGAGDWYQLENGSWIAAFLVNNPPASLPIVNVGPPPLPTPPPTPLQSLAPTSPPLALPAAPSLPATAIAAPVVSNITPQESDCDPSYPTICIPRNAPDLDCHEISERRFEVLQPDPHRFDGDKDGIGCERD